MVDNNIASDINFKNDIGRATRIRPEDLLPLPDPKLPVGYSHSNSAIVNLAARPDPNGQEGKNRLGRACPNYLAGWIGIIRIEKR